jgi:MSHA pilin protein MshA
MFLTFLDDHWCITLKWLMYCITPPWQRYPMIQLKPGRQAGFTLIELIVVIVILGVLAATALPRFSDLSIVARAASISAANGALTATAAMAHGKYLATSPRPSTVTLEGITLTFSTGFASGYPKADVNLAAAAGLNATDYTLSAAGTTLTVVPVGATEPEKCSVTYDEPISATAAPVIILDIRGC